MMPELHDAKTCPTCVRMRERAETTTVGLGCVLAAIAFLVIALGPWVALIVREQR